MKVVNKIKELGKGLTTSSGQIIIIGGNEVSIQLAERLIQAGQNIVVIEEDEEVRKQVQERIDVLALQGKGTEIEILKRAGIQKTNLVIAITEDDQQNLLTGIYARQLGVENIIVQVTEGKSADHNLLVEELNLDLVVNPFAIVVKKVKDLINPGMELIFDKFLDKKVKITKLKVAHHSSFAYSTIKQLTMSGDSLILAILRKNRVIIPQGEDKIYPGDTIFIIYQASFKSKLGKLVNHNPADKDKIVLIGGGEINYQLANDFANRATVTIIEDDLEACEIMADNLLDVLVLQGRGTDIDLLKEEGVAKADIFVAGTAKDESNLLMASLAKKLGVKESIAIVRDVHYSSLNDFLDIDHIISPYLNAIDTILAYLYQGQVETNTILDGQAKLSEITITSRSAKEIKKLNLPSDTIIALIKRNKKVLIPSGETKLQKGDKIIVLSLVAKGDIKKYF